MRRLFAHLFGRRRLAVTEARAGDAAAFSLLHTAAFHRGWSEDEMERLLLDPTVTAHRITSGRKLAGFILSRRAGDEAEILSVAVDPQYRGRGLARMLLEFHLRFLAGRAVSTAFLEVDEVNAPARQLYARAGFTQVGRRESYYADAEGGRSAALVLRRNL
jgi:ribosomal-protein-alanine N-acetyltransferase